jgi:VIT1/CCC1 family predicted Fe2+/Mn2+ transporter
MSGACPAFSERGAVQSPEKRPARIPDTPQRARLEKQRSIREIIFGVQDGLLTTLGIVTGVGSATADRATILLTGLLSLVVGALSMGVGQYLGDKAEREVVENAIAFERQEMLEKPKEEFAEQVGFYTLKGFTKNEARTIVERLAKNPEIWLHEMVRDEFGVDPRIADGKGVGPAFAMAGSFTLGGLAPILPYVLPLRLPIAGSVAPLVAAVMLFAIGAFAGRLGGRNPLLKGLEIVVFGAGVFVVSYVVGHFIPPLFGRGAVNVGG